MWITILNALLYNCLMRKVWKSIRILSLGTTLVAMYSIVSIACIATYAMDIQEFKLTLWPFLYLYLAFLLAARPFINGNVSISSFSIQNDKLCKYVIIVMLVAGLGNLYYSLGASVDVIVQDQIAEIYKDKADTVMSVNRIDWLSKNINNYGVIPFSLIVFYNFTSDDKKRIRFAAIAFAVVFASLFCTSAIRALRWNMLSDTIALISGYLLFYNKIPTKRRHFINIIMISSGIALLTFFAVVAIARYSFSYSDYGGDANASLIFYLGHSMMVFCYGITDTIHTYLNGAYMFGIPNNKDIGIHSAGDFPTIFGNLYIDFGPIGTLIICAITGTIFKKFITVKSMADAFLLISYFRFLAMGVFTQPFGYAINWVITIIMYILIKIAIK